MPLVLALVGSTWAASHLNGLWHFVAAGVRARPSSTRTRPTPPAASCARCSAAPRCACAGTWVAALIVILVAHRVRESAPGTSRRARADDAPVRHHHARRRDGAARHVPASRRRHHRGRSRRGHDPGAHTLRFTYGRDRGRDHRSGSCSPRRCSRASSGELRSSSSRTSRELAATCDPADARPPTVTVPEHSPSLITLGLVAGR